jgi:NADPH:quinone reductase-like Zn-dependent oxidoreductase
VVTPGNQGIGERGSYAEYVHAAAERVVKLPDHVSLREAATLPTAGMTAWEATVDVGQAGPGKTVVVNGGAGGTGSFAIQIARLVGARVATTCSARNFDYVTALGAERAIDYHQGDVYAQIREWAPEGVDVVVDTVGQGTFVDVVDTMKRAEAASVTVVPTISSFPNQPRQLRALVEALGAGTIRAPEYTVLPLEQAGEAHRRVQDGHVRGKILLDVDSSLDA